MYIEVVQAIDVLNIFFPVMFFYCARGKYFYIGYMGWACFKGWLFHTK